MDYRRHKHRRSRDSGCGYHRICTLSSDRACVDNVHNYSQPSRPVSGSGAREHQRCNSQFALPRGVIDHRHAEWRGWHVIPFPDFAPDVEVLPRDVLNRAAVTKPRLNEEARQVVRRVADIHIAKCYIANMPSAVGAKCRPAMVEFNTLEQHIFRAVAKTALKCLHARLTSSAPQSVASAWTPPGRLGACNLHVRNLHCRQACRCQP